MNSTELRSKTVEQLNEELEALLKAHFSLRMQKSMQQLTKTSELRTVRRNIARVRTIIGEKVA